MRWTAPLLIAATFAFASPALAGPSEADKNAARTSVYQGDELAKEGDWEGALEAYRRADDIMGVPTTSIEVGRAALELARLLEARAAFQKALDYPVKDGEPEVFAEARDNAKDELEKIERRIPHLLLTVTGVKDGVAVTARVDGEPIELGQEIDLDPGEHQLEAEADGYVTINQPLVIDEYAIEDLELQMRVARTSLWPMVWAGFGVAAGGAIIGSVTGALSLKDASEAKELCEPGNPNRCPLEADGPLRSARTLAHVSTASFVVAGLGAGLGIAGLVISLSADDSDGGADDSDDEGIDAALTVGPGSLWLTGTF